MTDAEIALRNNLTISDIFIGEIFIGTDYYAVRNRAIYNLRLEGMYWRDLGERFQISKERARQIFKKVRENRRAKALRITQDRKKFRQPIRFAEPRGIWLHFYPGDKF